MVTGSTPLPPAFNRHYCRPFGYTHQPKPASPRLRTKRSFNSQQGDVPVYPYQTCIQVLRLFPQPRLCSRCEFHFVRAKLQINQPRALSPTNSVTPQLSKHSKGKKTARLKTLRPRTTVLNGTRRRRSGTQARTNSCLAHLALRYRTRCRASCCTLAEARYP